MSQDVKQKAKLILAGLAALPTMVAATADASEIRKSAYGCPAPYSEDCFQVDTGVSGLTEAELNEGLALVKELNALKVVKVTELVLSKAPRIPYRYNMPDESQVEASRKANLERIEKLRAMIEAAQ